MKIFSIFVILAFVGCGECQAYYSDQDPDQPKLYHNEPGVSATSDEDIEKKIWYIMKTEWLPYDIGGVAFTVNKGNVTLTGSVETLANKNKIEREIKRIDGVRRIKNRLEVIKK
jgi:osmotically-inducible protein OsmY